MWFSLRSALIRVAALLGLACAFGNAAAYNATVTTDGAPSVKYRWGQTLSGTWGTTLYSGAVAACSSSEAQASCLSLGGYAGTTYNSMSGAYCFWNKSGGGTVGCGVADSAPGGAQCATGFSNVGGTCTKYTCPSGGTLSGSICTCAPGETDTGSACAACPAGQYKRLPGSACEAKCPEGQGNGPASYPPNGAAGFCMDKQEFAVGVGWVDGATTTTVPRCKYHGVGITMCGDYGSGVACYSDTTYGLGVECTTETFVPDTPTTCDAGDLWCKNTSGTCASGFIAGTFNGENLCVKVGETVTVTPRAVSALDPVPTTPAPPASLPGSSGSSSSVPTDGGTVIAIGARAGTVGGAGGGTGTGAGSGGTGEDVECGLPGMPPCKIDETGTPTSGNFSDGTTKLGEAVDAMKGVATEAGKTTGRDTGWKISFGTPSGCTNPAPIVLPHVTWQPNLCAYETEIHAVMSFLWILLTLGSCLSMIRSTATGGV